MIKYLVWIIGAMSIASLGNAQFTYTIDQTIPVEHKGKKLAMPWAGGLNAVQLNTIDLNGDKKKDLVIFDRTANQLIPFLNVNNHYQYAPSYASLFPEQIDQWLLLRDFNCDGKEDIFTSNPFGISVFVNTTSAGKPISWRAFNAGNPLLTTGYSGKINLKVNNSDIPAIDDVDGDGDLDILNVRFVGIGTVEWHKNVSLETRGKCDSLQLQRITQTWGEFEDCTCGKVFFKTNKTCAEILSTARIQHTGGKSLLTVDFDSNGVRDLFFSEESCSNLYLLTNSGTSTNASITSLIPFPEATPLSLPFYPTPYIEDVDFDGQADLIVSSNISTRINLSQNFQESIYLFKNISPNQTVQFSLLKSNFLQGEMIDVGDFSVPAFFDLDNDGDQDLLVSQYTTANRSGQIYNYENVGNAQSPAFKLTDTDFLSLSAINQHNLKIQFADMNKDGKTDLVLSCSNTSGVTGLFYITNTAEKGFVVQDASLVPVPFLLQPSDNWHVVDIDEDGWKDLLVGNNTGAIEYWKNTRNNSYTLITSQYAGVGNSTDRQNVAISSADLDGDGQLDLVVGDQHGQLALYSHYKSISTTSTPITNLFFNEFSQTYISQKLGGRAWPTVVNLFQTSRPNIVVGNCLGGLHVLKNEHITNPSSQLTITISPNPNSLQKAQPIIIQSNKNVYFQIYNLLGQCVSGSHSISAQSQTAISISHLPAGIYIAFFTSTDQSLSKRFILIP